MDELVDPRFTMPRPSGASAFREAQRRMARWLDGPAHTSARRHAVDALASIDPSSLRQRAEHVSRSLLGAEPDADLARIVPIAVLADALGFDHPMQCARRQPLISAAFLALSTPVPPEIEQLLAEQLRATGRSDPDEAANVVALLHQCYGATAALIDDVVPPVASTVRMSPDGVLVEVPLDEAPFGQGSHACPAREHAQAIAAGTCPSSWEDS